MALAALAATTTSKQGARSRSRPNIILLSIDTLRADHLGCYGYGRNTSPVIDRLAQESVLFTEAHAPSPWTLPSHAAMLTGRHPFALRIYDKAGVLPADVTTVAEILHAADYQTAAFVDSMPDGFVGGLRGFDRGFDVYRHSARARHGGFAYDMKATVGSAARWIARRDVARPFFLFLHTKSVHAAPANVADPDEAPYFKPEPYVRRFLPRGSQFSWRVGPKAGGVGYLRYLNARIASHLLDPKAFPREQLEELVALYDAGIYYVDEQVGRLREVLSAQGAGDDTVLILTADHGEAFLDHRFFLHRELYRPLLRVPLIVHDPRVTRAGRVEAATHLEDVAATIIALAGVPLPPALEGAALPRKGTPRSRPHFSYYRFGDEENYEAYSVQDGSWKLVLHQLARHRDFESELYDLGLDPAEQHPLGEVPEKAAVVAKLLAYFGPPGTAPEERRRLGPEALDELRALGYVQ